MKKFYAVVLAAGLLLGVTGCIGQAPSDIENKAEIVTLGDPQRRTVHHLYIFDDETNELLGHFVFQGYVKYDMTGREYILAATPLPEFVDSKFAVAVPIGK